MSDELSMQSGAPGATGPDEATRNVANSQQMVLYSIVASGVSNALARTDVLPAILALVVGLGVAAFSIWAVVRLCKSLGQGPVPWVIAMFIPIVNLVCLVILNQKATKYLQERGIKVGFLGTRL